MRVQLTAFLLFFAMGVHAVDDRSMKELFRKYDQVMLQKKTELIDEVFTKKFLRESGGKEEFTEKVKELSAPSQKAVKETKLNWKKGLKDNIYLVKMKAPNKSKASADSEFIVVEEDGKLKIDGTVGDAQ